MKHFFSVLQVLILAAYALTSQAQRGISPDSLNRQLKRTLSFTIFNDNYFTTGTSLGVKPTADNSDAKFQISFKQRLTDLILPGKTYLFLTYTQKSFWAIYKSSKPFEESNYNPGFGIGKPIFVNNNLRGIATLRVEHESNGRDSCNSRSWNFTSLNYRAFLAKNLSLSIRAWAPFEVEQKDLFDYIGYGEASLTWIAKPNRLVVDVAARKGVVDWRGSVQASVSYRPFKAANQYLFLQWYQGYAENLIHYQDYTSKLRIGIAIKPAGLI
jgi:phospholipase A1